MSVEPDDLHTNILIFHVNTEIITADALRELLEEVSNPDPVNLVHFHRLNFKKSKI